ncbi:MAG TPA: anthranilate synthase component I [Candidatus Binatia bacterium]|nr:anthranilate synthase component I [Candidatus Binatia bacterium]
MNAARRIARAPTLRAGDAYPARGDLRALAREGNVVPVCREILADLETPVSAFLKIHRGPYGFLLESVEGGEKWGRYSFLGTEPARIFRVRGRTVEIETPGRSPVRREVDDPLDTLRTLLAQYRPVPVPGLPRFSGGAVGAIGYDMVRTFERLPARVPDDLGVPDACLLVAESLLVFDAVAQKIKVVSHARVDGELGLDDAYDAAVARVDALIARLGAPPQEPEPVGTRPGDLHSNVSEAEYRAMVERAKEYIRAGDVIQVVLAQRFDVPLAAAPFNVYRCSRTVNPSPYMFYLALGDHEIVGASPELMVRVEGGEVTVRPIAGTRRRGTAEQDDVALAAELVADPKERAEHLMLLDLGRNDVGRVAAIGSVEVTESFAIERYSHVMHLVSNVRGRLAPGRDCFDAFRATFPAGTLTGAPKIRAMEIIEELEPVRRGTYGGAVGYFGFSGAMDTAITIRTALVKDGRVYVQTGAGIVADSDPASEHAECVNKARAMIQAVRLAEAL